VGIDPGSLGGLGILDEGDDGGFVAAALHRTPRVTVMRNRKWRFDYDPVAMRELLARALDGPTPTSLHGVTVALEAQGARPGQGVASSYRTGVGFGLWLGLIVAARVAYHVVSPQVWKRHAGLLGAPKRASRLRAQERFPMVGAIAPADEGPAEALLLASYLAGTRTEGLTDASCPRTASR
jgi:crossover junction endodeoxyribonuclease RuvC